MTTTETAVTTPAETTRSIRDLRRFWRITLAILLPLPLLSLGITYLLAPLHEDGSFAAAVADAQAGRGLFELRSWIELPFLVGMVPACLAAAWVARRGAPVLATIAGVLTALGFGAGFSGQFPGDRIMATAIVELGLDRGTVERLNAYMWDQPLAGLAIGLFLLGGVMIGLAVLGVALWRSRTAPWWAGLALIIAGPTHPFMPNTLVSGLGLILGAVGFAGVSWHLLRSRNDDLDLPPYRSQR
jgi:hypothetical protein